MKKASKKGFTLIELMIVLAIIAILAMVLIPKAGNFKSQAKNSGVATNVNTVRAYLENKVMDNFILDSTATTDSAKGITALSTKLDTVFTGTDDIKNPLNNDSSTDTASAASASAAPAILIVSDGTSVTDSNNLGSVVIVYDITKKQYTVYGIDADGNKVNSAVIK